MVDGTGEHPNGRKAMDAEIQRRIDHGQKSDAAIAAARKIAQKMDRNNYGRN